MWHKACILVKVYADKIWQATQEKAQNKDSATKRLSHQAVATLVQATCAGAMGGSRPIECAILVVLASLLTRKQVRRIHDYTGIYWDTQRWRAYEGSLLVAYLLKPSAHDKLLAVWRFHLFGLRFEMNSGSSLQKLSRWASKLTWSHLWLWTGWIRGCTVNIATRMSRWLIVAASASNNRQNTTGFKFHLLKNTAKNITPETMRKGGGMNVPSLGGGMFSKLAASAGHALPQAIGKQSQGCSQKSWGCDVLGSSKIKGCNASFWNNFFHITDLEKPGYLGSPYSQQIRAFASETVKISCLDGWEKKGWKRSNNTSSFATLRPDTVIVRSDGHFNFSPLPPRPRHPYLPHPLHWP